MKNSGKTRNGAKDESKTIFSGKMKRAREEPAQFTTSQYKRRMRVGSSSKAETHRIAIAIEMYVV